MNATFSAKLLLIAGIAIQSTAINAKPAQPNNTDNSTDVEASSSAQGHLPEQNSTLDEALSDQATLEQLEQENAALDAMLKKVTELKEDTPPNVTHNISIDTAPDSTPSSVLIPEEGVSQQETLPDNEVVSNTPIPISQVDDNSLEVESEQGKSTYNYERTPLGEGDIFIPILSDARVFAEFVDKLPAVVNYYTTASEEDVVRFYSDAFGEPIGQERKRNRLTLVYTLNGATSTVVISQQDDRRQVDVLQKGSM